RAVRVAGRRSRKAARRTGMAQAQAPPALLERLRRPAASSLTAPSRRPASHDLERRAETLLHSGEDHRSGRERAGAAVVDAVRPGDLIGHAAGRVSRRARERALLIK